MRRFTRLGCALLMLTAPAVMGAGCGSDEEPASQGATGSTAKDKRLLWVQPLRNHPVHRIMQAGFMSECKKLGYECEIAGNPSATTVDVPATVSLAEAAMASKKFGGVGVYAFDPQMYPFVKKVHDEGHPTVSWHIYLKEGEVPGLDATTGANPTDYAKNAAQAMGEAIGGKGTVAVTEGSFNTLENTVAEQFTKTIEQEFPDVKVLEPQEEGFEPSKAQSKAVGIIEGNPSVVGAFSTTGGGPQTWSTAQRQAGRKLTIISMDYVRQNLDLVKSGEVYGLVAQPLFEEGAKTAEVLAQMAEGKEVPYYNYLPAPVITKPDLTKYYELLDQAGQ